MIFWSRLLENPWIMHFWNLLSIMELYLRLMVVYIHLKRKHILRSKYKLLIFFLILSKKRTWKLLASWNCLNVSKRFRPRDNFLFLSSATTSPGTFSRQASHRRVPLHISLGYLIWPRSRSISHNVRPGYLVSTRKHFQELVSRGQTEFEIRFI